MTIWNDRVSPVFDVAQRLTLNTVEAGRIVSVRDLAIPNQDVPARVNLLSEMKVDVLLCGAISGCLRQLLEKRGIRVVSNVCGPFEQVLKAFLENRLTEEGLMMPGCGRGKGLRRRCRRRGRCGAPQEPERSK